MQFLLGLIILICATIQGCMETELYGHVVNVFPVIGGMIVGAAFMWKPINKFMDTLIQ